MLNNGAVGWRSQRQPTVALSIVEAEYIALTEATKVKMCQNLPGYNNSKSDSAPTELYWDNQSAIALAKNPVSHARVKHIDIRHHFIREAIQDQIIWVQYIPTAEMTADSLTKALGREKHEKCTVRMGMTYWYVVYFIDWIAWRISFLSVYHSGFGYHRSAIEDWRELLNSESATTSPFLQSYKWEC